MTHLHKEMGGRIRAARKARGFNQGDLADKIGVTRPAVGQWENGQTRPDGVNLIALGEALGVDWAALADGRSEDPRPSFLIQRKPVTREDVLACLTAYVREHGKREGLLDALLPPERQDEGIARAMGLIEYLSREDSADAG